MKPKTLEFVLEKAEAFDVETLDAMVAEGVDPFGCGCCSTYIHAREAWMTDEDIDNMGISTLWVRNDDHKLIWVGRKDTE